MYNNKEQKSNMETCLPHQPLTKKNNDTADTAKIY